MGGDNISHPPSRGGWFAWSVLVLHVFMSIMTDEGTGRRQEESKQKNN
jgi:hypothetical protein